MGWGAMIPIHARRSGRQLSIRSRYRSGRMTLTRTVGTTIRPAIASGLRRSDRGTASTVNARRILIRCGGKSCAQVRAVNLMIAIGLSVSIDHVIRHVSTPRVFYKCNCYRTSADEQIRSLRLSASNYVEPLICYISPLY